MKSSKKKALTVTLGAILMVVTIGITYAFITQTLTGTKKVTITAGTLSLVLDEGNAITISDALPMYDAVGMTQDKVFTFSLVNNTSNSTDYVLKLSKIASDNELSEDDVKYYLTKEGVGTPALLSSLTEGVIDTGTIVGGDTINYTLRLWIRDGVTDQTTIAGKSLSYKLAVEASMIEVEETIENDIFITFINDDNGELMTGPLVITMEDGEGNVIWETDYDIGYDTGVNGVLALSTANIPNGSYYFNIAPGYKSMGSLEITGPGTYEVTMWFT